MSDTQKKTNFDAHELRNTFVQSPAVRTLTFIVTHTKPMVPSRYYDHAIALGNYGEELPTHIASLDPFWHVARPISFQAAGSYVIPQAIKQLRSTPSIIGLMSQRKIISRTALGEAARQAPHMQQIKNIDFDNINIEDTRPANEHEFFVAQPLYFQEGLVAQYASCHQVVDLFFYMDLAFEAGILTLAEMNEFALEKSFIPGGCELGFFPASWLLPTLTKLSEIGRMFLVRQHHRICTYDDYQIRVLGFLAERLGSFLLFKQLKTIYGLPIDKSVFGHLCTVVINEDYARGLASRSPQSGDLALDTNRELLESLYKSYASITGKHLGPNQCIGKVATQSSVGRWSRSNDPNEDASGAISGTVTGFYSFHTDLENGPWWMVDLGEALSIGEIRIFNAEPAIAWRAAKFVLESSSDCQAWYVRHERIDEAPFGGYHGHPFVWRPQQQVTARYIRVRLTTRNWLHLDQVEVYSALVDNRATDSITPFLKDSGNSDD